VRLQHDEGADDYVPGHGDTSYDVGHYDLELGYTMHTNHLDGVATINATAREDLDEVTLDLRGLSVDKVSVDGDRVKYSAGRGRVRVRLDEPVAAGEELVLRVAYSGTPKPVRARALGSTGWEELSDGVIVSGQPHGAPSWFPCNDRPSSKAGYRIAVTVESGYRVVSNGSLVDKQRRSSKTRWVYEQEQPMAPYLATVQMGRYEWLETDDSPVPVAAAVPRRLVDRYPLAFGRQGEMVDFFAELFGDYPFDSYSVVVTDDDLEIPLESQSLSTFGANHLQDDWECVRLVAHELSHSWFGNCLTAGAWRDIWLHEGFACYAEWLWSEHSGHRSAQEQAERHWEKLSKADQDLELADPGADLMFDDRVYKRGALLLHALRSTLGDKTFFGMLRDWVRQHAYGNVSTEMFIGFVAQHTKDDLGPLFTSWLRETELPDLPARR
jgi:aminopeptidase N